MKPALDKSEYEMLAAWRFALRRFLSFSENLAETSGLASQQYLAMLVIKGKPRNEAVTVGELAQQLLIKHHSAVGLVNRMEVQGLVTRGGMREDRRKVAVRLTAYGTGLVEKLAAAHRIELHRIGPQLQELMRSFSQPPRKTTHPLGTPVLQTAKVTPITSKRRIR